MTSPDEQYIYYLEQLRERGLGFIIRYVESVRHNSGLDAALTLARGLATSAGRRFEVGPHRGCNCGCGGGCGCGTRTVVETRRRRHRRTR